MQITLDTLMKEFDYLKGFIGSTDGAKLHMNKESLEAFMDRMGMKKEKQAITETGKAQMAGIPIIFNHRIPVNRAVLFARGVYTIVKLD